MVVSPGQNFIANQMEAYDFRRIRGFIKITINRLTNHGAKFLHIPALSVNAIAKCAGVEPAVHLVLAYFKDDFTHDSTLPGPRHLGKGDC